MPAERGAAETAAAGGAGAESPGSRPPAGRPPAVPASGGAGPRRPSPPGRRAGMLGVRNRQEKLEPGRQAKARLTRAAAWRPCERRGERQRGKEAQRGRPPRAAGAAQGHCND